MSAAHTAGPWYVSQNERNGDHHGCVAIRTKSAFFGKDPFPIVEPGAISGRNLTECDANARLIAAAPTLLDALKQAVERQACYVEWLSRKAIRSVPLTDDEREMLKDMRANMADYRAALAAAEGGAK